MSRNTINYDSDRLTNSLENNTLIMQQAFLNDDTFITRHVENAEKKAYQFTLFFIDGMINNELVNDKVIKPLINYSFNVALSGLTQVLVNQVLEANQIKTSESKVELVQAILNGETVLFTNDCKEGIIISTRDAIGRQIEEPVSEKVLRGPREGFTEAIMTNLSLVRRKIQSPEIKFKYKEYGKVTKTKVCTCYIDGIVDQQIVNQINTRLDTLDLDSVLDTNYIIESIKDSPKSPFKTIGSTERPDVVAAKLLEGRIAIFVDGTPVVATLPYLFIENFQSNDDYYINYYFSSVGRLIRLIGFFITVSLPALYLALVTFHHEIIPTELILSIYASRQGVPFPSVIELLGLLLVFEILREAGTRMPAQVGQALSIVGALVLGQAAVDANFVSAPVVIIVGFSGITSLMVPKAMGALIVIRLVLILLSGFIGLYGYVFGVSALFIHLFGIKSFGVPYMTKLTSYRLGDLRDTFFRAPWNYMQKTNEPDIEPKD